MLDARQHCAVAMLNFLLAFAVLIVSVVESSHLFVFLESDFSDFQGRAVWLNDVPNSKTALILLVLETQSLRESGRALEVFFVLSGAFHSELLATEDFAVLLWDPIIMWFKQPVGVAVEGHEASLPQAKYSVII